MRSFRIAALGFAALMLAACQTNTTYVPIIANPMQIEMAEARCQMMSGSVQQGMVAWGSPGYVAGAQIGNALGNAIRVDQFMQQCMTLHGWKRVAATTGANKKVQPKYAATGKPYKGAGEFPPVPK